METKDLTLSLALALDACRKEGKRSLTLETGVYTLTPELAPSRPLSISNHDTFGFTSIGICLEGLDGFTLDGNGSTLIADGAMVSLAIREWTATTVTSSPYSAAI